MAKLAGRILHTKPDQHRPAPVSQHKFICSIVSLPDVIWVNDITTSSFSVVGNQNYV